MASSTSLRFAETVRVLSTETRSMNLDVPVFRSPPRLPGRDRTVRRRRVGGGSVVVAVRLVDRPFASVQADLIEGICVANRVTGHEAEVLRGRMWDALERAGQLVVVLMRDGPRRLEAA